MIYIQSTSIEFPVSEGAKDIKLFLNFVLFSIFPFSTELRKNPPPKINMDTLLFYIDASAYEDISSEQICKAFAFLLFLYSVLSYREFFLILNKSIKSFVIK